MQPTPLPTSSPAPKLPRPLDKQLRRPSDFVDAARLKTADIRHDNGRWVVRHRGRTIGFTDRGNKEYTKQYRHLLIKAFMAAGLLGVLMFFIKPLL